MCVFVTRAERCAEKHAKNHNELVLGQPAE